jgi:hypothetical protein
MGENLLGFLTIYNHFDSKNDYRSTSLAEDEPNGQFEFYACSHKCLEDFLTKNIRALKKQKKASVLKKSIS